MMRVAQRLGFQSVDAMVANVPDEELERWLALAWLDGWGDEWQMVASICATVWNAALRICKQIPLTNGIQNDEIRTPLDFLPAHLRPPEIKKKKKTKLSTDEQAKRLAGIK